MSDHPLTKCEEEDASVCNDGRVTDFYLTPEYRRTAIWGMLGCLLIFVAGLAVQRFHAGRFEANRIFGLAVFLVIFCWLSQYLLPRIRIDEIGIRQRVLWWWTLWPWEAFTTGRIRPGRVGVYSYEYSERPQLTRNLTLAFLSKSDADRVHDLIRRVWVRPPAESLPTAIQVQRYGAHLHALEMTADRLYIISRQQTSIYTWDDVLAVEIWRIEHGRHDFLRLRIVVPDQNIVLFGKLAGASKEAIAGMLIQRVAASRIDEFAEFGAPRNVKEVDARLARIANQQTSTLFFRRWFLCLNCVVIPGMLANAWFHGAGRAVPLLTCAPLGYAVYWLMQDKVRELEKNATELQIEREKLLSTQEQKSEVT